MESKRGAAEAAEGAEQVRVCPKYIYNLRAADVSILYIEI